MRVDDMLEQGRDALTVRKIFGEPYERDGVAIIPAAVVRGGGGGGSGEDMNGNQGGGGGFGLSGRPVGAYVIKDGEVTWVPAMDQTRIFVLRQVAGFIVLLMLRTLVKRLVKRR